MLEAEGYNTLPAYPAGGHLEEGYAALAQRLLASGQAVWLIDGMSGIAWESLEQGLRTVLAGREATFIDVSSARLQAPDLRRLLAPALDNGDSTFGRLYQGTLADFFSPAALRDLAWQARQAAQAGAPVICYGQGSALLPIEGALIWADLPKELITARAARGEAALLGSSVYPAFKSMYWVDWPVMERHKTQLLPRLTLYLDLSQPERPIFIEGSALRNTLAALARRPFRVKPVFYPGPWGGQWMKRYMGLDPQQPNYAWSYELITPENGVLFSEGKRLLEVPFELLMAQETLAIQGAEVAAQFGSSFPIRFNYDDTLEGGHLSCQVHPQSEYARREFGLPYTQHETYYVLRAGPRGLCYLGLQEGIDPQDFRRAAEQARDAGQPFDTETFVNAWPTRTHDLFLIPAGTVHNSGANNVVLEISSTPYLYTFKIYDYLRRDLEGKFRPLHIERAWENIDFSRRTRWVRHQLIPSPRLLRQGAGWSEYLIGTHPLLFFAINRAEFGEDYESDTAHERHERFHVLNLVEGTRVLVEWEGGTHPLSYAETIVIPAATGRYRLRNLGAGICKVVKAYVKSQEGMDRS
jgi:mannose-6-phosphate isomerase class I